MTTWVLIHTETNILAQSYQGSWKRTWFDATTFPSTPIDWVTAVKAKLAIIAPGVVILTANVWAPQGHEADPTNTDVHVDVTLGLNPQLYPANVALEPQQWQLILLLLAGAGAAKVIGDVTGIFHKGSSSGGGSSSGSSLTDMMQPIMMIMMLSMMMPMMQNMMPKGND